MPELPDHVLRDLLQSFQIEAVEHLQMLNQSLLQLERAVDEARRKELVQDAFRAAHSLKGAARAVNLQSIEGAAHTIESVLQKARDRNVGLEVTTCDVLYSILDAIQQMLDGEQVDIRPLQERLASLTGGAPVTAANTTPAAIPEENTEEIGFRVIADETIRVAVSKLDALMAKTGELLVSKVSAEQRLTDLQVIHQQLSGWDKMRRELKTSLLRSNGDNRQLLQETLSHQHDYFQSILKSFEALEQSLRGDAIRFGMMMAEIQEDVRRVRMLPFQTIALGLERTVRDAARVEGKEVVFSIEGSDVEVDKKVLETLKDPLLHLLRNAVSHGIEQPSARIAANKSPAGRIRLTVRQRGSEVSLAVSDDGRGFDIEALRRAAQVESDGDSESSEANDIDLAFLPGVTTAPHITAISGRGVGLDVVRERVETIHGRIAVHNMPGQGVSIELIVPTSLAITRGLLVQIGSEQFALPLLTVERIVEVQETFSIGGKPMLRFNETSVPLVPLSAILERPFPIDEKMDASLALIIRVAEQRLAIQVDSVVTELELAVKPLTAPLRRVRNVAGIALLGNGTPVIVLNPADMTRSAHRVAAPARRFDANEADKVQSMARILVVDDSITTRTLEKNILETAGYHVTTAIDGVEALRRLAELSTDLVVSDVQMPNMDGFTLARQIRERPELSGLPVILVTSLEGQEDREKGMEAGADAYIVKRGFNQANLLTTIRQFLEGVGK